MSLLALSLSRIDSAFSFNFTLNFAVYLTEDVVVNIDVGIIVACSSNDFDCAPKLIIVADP